MAQGMFGGGTSTMTQEPSVLVLQNRHTADKYSLSRLLAQFPLHAGKRLKAGAKPLGRTRDSTEPSRVHGGSGNQTS